MEMQNKQNEEVVERRIDQGQQRCGGLGGKARLDWGLTIVLACHKRVVAWGFHLQPPQGPWTNTMSSGSTGDCEAGMTMLSCP